LAALRQTPAKVEVDISVLRVDAWCECML
jgi:hypothetical protein